MAIDLYREDLAQGDQWSADFYRTWRAVGAHRCVGAPDT